MLPPISRGTLSFYITSGKPKGLIVWWRQALPSAMPLKESLQKGWSEVRIVERGWIHIAGCSMPLCHNILFERFVVLLKKN